MSLIGGVPFRWMTITVELDRSPWRAIRGNRSVELVLSESASQPQLERELREVFASFPRSRIVTPPIAVRFVGAETLDRLGPEGRERLCAAAIAAGASTARVWPPSARERRAGLFFGLAVYAALGLAGWGFWYALLR